MNADSADVGKRLPKRYCVLYEQGPSSLGASVPDLPGCFAVGKTFDETEKLIRIAIELYIKQLHADGKPVPEPAMQTGSMSVAT